ncbi:uncharacterized protein L201_005363 [Kwoniella dendrophila CBS 6074]|uniref:Phosphatidylinositol glycan, class T n=1 Tax=Kwoniella dendrophila CBS 6074 TaxID=1295534 RepID=A0AAX4K001_9TREE
MLLSSLRLLLLAPIYAAVSKQTITKHEDAFSESLTLHPLPDGRMSVLFEFETTFSSSGTSSRISQSHHSLTPPSLLLPLEKNNVSELTISFTSGWDQARSSSSGLLNYESSGGGGEIRGWLKDSNDVEERWNSVTNALGGLFCAGLGQKDKGDNTRDFGGIYPQKRKIDNTTHFLLSHPESQLCTENLTPFLSLLPSKGISGLSALLSQPGIIFSWESQSEGIEVLMPDRNAQGRWKGWWEGIIDLVPSNNVNGNGNDNQRNRNFSIEKIFRKKIPNPFPESQRSILRLITENDNMKTSPQGRKSQRWIDGKCRDVVEWDLKDKNLTGQNIEFWWNGENSFQYPRHIPPPPITVTRTVIDKLASDGTFQITIINNDNIERRAIYSEIWPWWVKGWMSEIEIFVENKKRPELLEDLSYNPSKPPTISTTTLHFTLTIPAKSQLILRIPFSKLTLKYTEHRPDAERGIEISSGILTLLDTLSEQQTSSSSYDSNEQEGEISGYNPRRTGRKRIYTNRLLLDIPTPDFSMPYNVIIMSSTVMAVFFGLMQGVLTRKWGWVEVSQKSDKTSSIVQKEQKQIVKNVSQSELYE